MISEKNRAYTELENDDRIFKLKDIQDYLDEKSFLLDVSKIKKQTIENFKNEITKKSSAIMTRTKNYYINTFSYP